MKKLAKYKVQIAVGDTLDFTEVEEVYRTPLRSCDLRRKVIVYKFSKK